LAPPYYSQRAVFASPLSASFHTGVCFAQVNRNEDYLSET